MMVLQKVDINLAGSGERDSEMLHRVQLSRPAQETLPAKRCFGQGGANRIESQNGASIPPR